MVIAPEHPFVARLTTPDQMTAVDAYVTAAARKSDALAHADEPLSHVPSHHVRLYWSA